MKDRLKSDNISISKYEAINFSDYLSDIKAYYQNLIEKVFPILVIKF